jgi:hypothetical protein
VTMSMWYEILNENTAAIPTVDMNLMGISLMRKSCNLNLAQAFPRRRCGEVARRHGDPPRGRVADVDLWAHHYWRSS